MHLFIQPFILQNVSEVLAFFLLGIEYFITNEIPVFSNNIIIFLQNPIDMVQVGVIRNKPTVDIKPILHAILENIIFMGVRERANKQYIQMFDVSLIAELSPSQKAYAQTVF